MEIISPTAASQFTAPIPSSDLNFNDSVMDEGHEAALKVQKVFRSYRTRRKLADSAVIAEELWWQAIDYARLNHSTISFFDDDEPESPHHRWTRITYNASKVGHGLALDAKARKLAFQHRIEAIDPRHRYGHNLHFYYEEWRKGNSGQPLFYWLDIGDGKDVELKECPRSKLRQQIIKYLGPEERKHYEYVVEDGKIVHKLTGEPLDTINGPNAGKWIFVMSAVKSLYAGKKKKGAFHHSSFLAGGAILSAGRVIAQDGFLKSIWAYSGHYHPTEENLNIFKTFLQENGLNLSDVEIRANSDDEDSSSYSGGSHGKYIPKMAPEALRVEVPDRNMENDVLVQSLSETLQKQTLQEEAKQNGTYQRSLSGGLQSPRRDIPAAAILQRINSKKSTNSYQLGHQLSKKWCSGAGPRIGCVADYPQVLRAQALEIVNLSPKGTSPSGAQQMPSPSPRSRFQCDVRSPGAHKLIIPTSS